MKRHLCWIALLVSFLAAVVWAPGLFGWAPLDGYAGPAILFFLGYCAIILVAQVFAAMKALRSLVEELVGPRRISKPVLCRDEQPAAAPEE